jgi:hypothetical protein
VGVDRLLAGVTAATLIGGALRLANNHIDSLSAIRRDLMQSA